MRPWPLLLLIASCASVPKPSPETAEENAPAPVCDADDDERLVLDWSAHDRSRLEAAVRHGIVPVRIDGCRARVVDTCSVNKRAYAFAATSRQREVMVVRDRDELGAKLPILATRLGASFSQSSALDVAMTVVGRYEAGPSPIAKSDLDGECDAVTHVVANLSVGAFSIATARATAVEGSIDVVSAAHAREKKRIDSAGIEEQCALARRSDDAPPEDCAIPLRVELRALSTKPRPSAPPPPTPVSEVDMKQAMENAKKQLVPCHRAARASSPNLSGVLTLGIRLNPRGYVRSVSAKHQGNLPDELSECAAQRVAMVMFPPAEDDKPRSVVLPIMFRGL
jgi:hypothetical protein